MKKWIIVYFDPDGEVYGPVWERESRVEPIWWANTSFPKGAQSYAVQEVKDFTEGYKDSFLKSLPKCARTKDKRGMASMNPEKRRAIASKGGKAAHQMGRAHTWSHDEAVEAGRKGGKLGKRGPARKPVEQSA